MRLLHSKLSFPIVILLTVILFNSCKEKIVDPIEEIKSPREYSWTVDTVYYLEGLQTIMWSISGSSTNDVYMVGHANGDGAMYHFDGQKWNPVELIKNYGIFGLLDAVYNLDKNNVWAVGVVGFYGNRTADAILHFDGSIWKKAMIGNPDSLNHFLYDVYATSPNDVWACGMYGIVYHYDGNKWTNETIKTNNPIETTFQLTSIRKIGNEVFALGIKILYNEANSIEYFYKKSGNSDWQIVDSFYNFGSTPKFGNGGLYSNGKRLFSYGDNGIFEWTGENWIHKISTTDFVSGISIDSRENIIFTDGNSVNYWNGNSKEELIRDGSAISLSGIWWNGKEVFITGITMSGFPQKTIIWHGK